jgi:threonine/homoserine/homoserine lactone efflux protein
MSLELYLAFVGATAILMLIPGPNVALIVANGVAHGARYGLTTVAGTSTAMMLQLAVTALGMTSLLTVLADWFDWLRWFGVGYLFYLAVRALRAPPVDLTRTAAQPRSAGTIFLRGLLVSLTNPKTLMFYGAFFPQFVDPAHPVGRQIAVLSGTFLGLAILLDGTWALLAGRFRRALAMSGRLRNRLTALFFIAAGIGVASARRS